MKTVEQIALEVANELGIIWREGCGFESGIVEVEAIDFAEKFLAAWLEQRSQEPVAWFDTTELERPHVVFSQSYVFREGDQFFLAPQTAIPEGYVLVPKEPSEAMLDAIRASGYDGNEIAIRQDYRAMIAAAQGEQE